MVSKTQMRIRWGIFWTLIVLIALAVLFEEPWVKRTGPHGEWQGRQYVNTFFGFQFTAPKGFDLLIREEFLGRKSAVERGGGLSEELIQRAVRRISKSVNFMAIAYSDSHSSLFMDLNAPDSKGSYIYVDDVLKHTLSALESGPIEVLSQSAARDFEVSDGHRKLKHVKVFARESSEGEVVEMNIYVFQHFEFIITLYTTARSAEDRNLLSDALRSFKRASYHPPNWRRDPSNY